MNCPGCEESKGKDGSVAAAKCGTCGYCATDAQSAEGVELGDGSLRLFCPPCDDDKYDGMPSVSGATIREIRIRPNGPPDSCGSCCVPTSSYYTYEDGCIPDDSKCAADA